jgi:hypothetical protein
LPLEFEGGSEVSEVLPYISGEFFGKVMNSHQPLEEEYAYYQERKGELLKQSNGKFALVKGKELVGIFDTDQDDYKTGLLHFGNVPFLIIRIQEGDDKNWIPVLQLGLLNASS